MKARFLLLLIFVGIFYSANSQSYKFLGSKIYGGNNSERQPFLLKVDERKLLIVGESRSDVSGNKSIGSCNPNSSNSDLWTLMVDTAFNIIWQNVYGGDASESYPTLIKAGNGNFMIGCISTSDSSCTRTEHLKGTADLLIIVIDSTGNLVWQKNFGGLSYCYGIKLIMLSDSNFVCLTSSNSGTGNDKSAPTHGARDLWLIKFDRNGNLIYEKDYGGIQEEFANATFTRCGLGLVETDDMHLQLSVQSTSNNSFDVTDTSYGMTDIWILNIDSLGNKISDYKVGGLADEWVTDAISYGSHFVLAGGTSSPQSGCISQPQPVPINRNGWIIEIDSSGNRVWDHRFVGGNLSSTGNEVILSIIPAANQQFWLSGYTENQAGFDVTDSAYGSADAWVIKIDSLGNKIWDKRFGCHGPTHANNMIVMANSSIFLICDADTGITDVKSELGYGYSDYYLVHFSYADNATGVNSIETSNENIILYPNPVLDVLYIQSKINEKIESIQISSIDGRMVLKQDVIGNSVNLSFLASGVYNCTLTAKGKIFNKLLVKQ